MISWPALNLGRVKARADIARARQAEAEAQYQQTIADFLQVLDAERTLLEAQDQLAQGRTDATTALVAVYRALGGSWEFPGVEP
ncbi:MAG TPA: TolC family protein [Gemmatimonadales bacterium]|nr:TolC family protein [Gemmatimonadales bacterium]